MSYFSLITGSYKHRTAASATFAEEAPHEKGFAEHYNKHLRILVGEFEQKRLETIRKASKWARIFLPLLVTAIAIYVYYWDEIAALNEVESDLVAALLAGPPVGALIAIVLTLSRYESDVKFHIFPKIMKFFHDYSYRAHVPSRVHSFEPWDVVPRFDLEESEDEVRGEYKGVGIDFFETTLSVRKRTRKGRVYHKSIFRGIVIQLDMKKAFKGKTILKENRSRLEELIANQFISLEQVRLEDPKFERVFDVYSDDQVEARYLLTTSFMERLLRLMEFLGSKKARCSFFQNSLLMMIPMKKNMFEPGSVFEPEDFVDDAKMILEEIHLIHQMVDVLKLDQDIGM